MPNKVSGFPIGRSKVSVSRRAAVVVLADLVAGAWLAVPGLAKLALQVRGRAQAGGSVVYLPVVAGPPVLVWDTAGDTWDNGAVWG